MPATDSHRLGNIVRLVALTKQSFDNSAPSSRECPAIGGGVVGARTKQTSQREHEKAAHFRGADDSAGEVWASVVVVAHARSSMRAAAKVGLMRMAASIGLVKTSGAQLIGPTYAV